MTTKYTRGVVGVVAGSPRIPALESCVPGQRASVGQAWSGTQDRHRITSSIAGQRLSSRLGTSNRINRVEAWVVGQVRAPAKPHISDLRRRWNRRFSWWLMRTDSRYW